MRIPRDVIPEMSQTQVIETGLYGVTVAEFEKTETPEPRSADAKTPAGCLMYKVQFRTQDDVPLWDQYYIGTADDPNADDPQGEAWKRFPAQRLAAMLNAAGVTEDDDSKIPRIIKGKKLTLDVVKEKDNKGNDRNNIKNFYSLAGAPKMPTPGGVKKPAGVKPAGAALLPSSVPPATSVPAVRKTAPPPPDEVEAGNGADVVAEAAEEIAAATPPPVTPKKKAAAAETTIPCELCDPIQHIVRSLYKKHIELHEAEEE